VVLFGQSAA